MSRHPATTDLPRHTPAEGLQPSPEDSARTSRTTTPGPSPNGQGRAPAHARPQVPNGLAPDAHQEDRAEASPRTGQQVRGQRSSQAGQQDMTSPSSPAPSGPGGEPSEEGADGPPGDRDRRLTLTERVDYTDESRRDCRSCKAFSPAPAGLGFGWCRAFRMHVKFYHPPQGFYSQCQFQVLTRPVKEPGRVRGEEEDS